MYVAVTVDLPADLAEEASMLLFEAGAMGVEVRDGEELPPPGMPAPPPGRALVVGSLEGDADGDTVARELAAELHSRNPAAEIRASSARLEEENWAETWKLHFKPLQVGPLAVVPPWESAAEPKVVIEPGMAFGTGGHATTELCLKGIVEHLRPGASVLDVGCGSGILGIAARKLGAGRVVMVDNDPIAVDVARENAERNGCPGIESSATPIGKVPGTFDLVLANILANTLTELAPDIAARTSGTLLLSGILVTQVDEVRRAYAAEGLAAGAVHSQGEWALLTMVRR